MAEFESLLNEFESPAECELTLTGRSGAAHTFRFRLPQSYGAWETLMRDAERFALAATRLLEYNDLKPFTMSDARMAAILHALCIEPAWDARQWLTFVIRAGVAAGKLFAQLAERIGMHVGEAEERALELEKKGLRTPSTDSM